MRYTVLCPICQSEIKEFCDDLSIKEFAISGMCQECQDTVFKLKAKGTAHDAFRDVYSIDYGSESICNWHELQAIIEHFDKTGKVQSDQISLDLDDATIEEFVDDVLDAMHARIGQPSPRMAMSFENLPTAMTKKDIFEGIRLRQYSDFTLYTRTEAIRRLSARGIHVWDQHFDPSDMVVRALCTEIEACHAQV